MHVLIFLFRQSVEAFLGFKPDPSFSATTGTLRPFAEVLQHHRTVTCRQEWMESEGRAAAYGSAIVL